MAKQTFTTGQVLTATQMNNLQANDYNWSVDTKTDNYVLVAGDAGKRIVMNSGTAKTITVNTSIFAAGDVVWIHNINTGTCTVTAGTATVNTASSLALAQWEGGALYFTSASTAIFFRTGSAYGVATGGSSSNITVGGVAFTLLTFTGDGTLTVTRPGLFDVLLVSGGGGGRRYAAAGGGGGGGGSVITRTLYLDSNQTVTIGAGGTQSDYATLSATPSTILGASSLGVGVPGPLGANDGSTGAALSASQYGGGCGSILAASNNSVTNFWGSKGGNATGSGTSGQGGGGGGGAGAVGGNASGTTGGAGGQGFDASSFRGEVAGTTRYGGGGGGGGTTGGAGGAGGGGAGNATSGNAGTANTGGGGGAGNANASASNGGSGILLVRFRA